MSQKCEQLSYGTFGGIFFGRVVPLRRWKAIKNNLATIKSRRQQRVSISFSKHNQHVLKTTSTRHKQLFVNWPRAPHNDNIVKTPPKYCHISTTYTANTSIPLPHRHGWQPSTPRWIPHHDVSKLVARPQVARGPDIQDGAHISHQRQLAYPPARGLSALRDPLRKTCKLERSQNDKRCKN